MNLYKATYNTVIHCEDDLEAAKIARELAIEDSAFTYEEESVKEVLCEDDLPCGWERHFHAITNGEGSYDDLKIKDILQMNTESLTLRKRIEELEKELERLENKIIKNENK
jgi:hypothetical protein